MRLLERGGAVLSQMLLEDCGKFSLFIEKFHSQVGDVEVVIYCRGQVIGRWV